MIKEINGKNEKVYNYYYDDMGGYFFGYGNYKRNKRDIRNYIEYKNKVYKLIENINGFYNKALIYENIEDEKEQFLLSYNTIVSIKKDNQIEIFGYYSKTTANHINYFINKYGLKSLCKKEIENTNILYIN